MPLTPPAPSPVPAFAKGLVHWIESTLVDPYIHLYDWVAGASNILDMEWRYFVLRWSRVTPATTTEDYAQIGFNVVNITQGDIDKTWTTQDYSDVGAALNTWLNVVTGHINVGFVVIDMRVYRRTFNPEVPWGQPTSTIDPATNKPYKRFAKQGPPQLVSSLNIPGTVANAPLPYQDALTVTFRTPAPKHWGRIYVPGLTGTDVTANGRWVTATTPVFANASAKLVADLAAKQFQLIVPSTQMDNVFAPHLQQVSQIVVDDVPDVIRRRRARLPAVRTIGAPA